MRLRKILSLESTTTHDFILSQYLPPVFFWDEVEGSAVIPFHSVSDWVHSYYCSLGSYRDWVWIFHADKFYSLTNHGVLGFSSEEVHVRAV